MPEVIYCLAGTKVPCVLQNNSEWNQDGVAQDEEDGRGHVGALSQQDVASDDGGKTGRNQNGINGGKAKRTAMDGSDGLRAAISGALSHA